MSHLPGRVQLGLHPRVTASVPACPGKTDVGRAAPAIPEQTPESVKEDVQWAKTRAQQGQR